jgi:hypothetical protein
MKFAAYFHEVSSSIKLAASAASGGAEPWTSKPVNGYKFFLTLSDGS